MSEPADLVMIKGNFQKKKINKLKLFGRLFVIHSFEFCIEFIFGRKIEKNGKFVSARKKWGKKSKMPKLVSLLPLLSVLPPGAPFF